MASENLPAKTHFTIAEDNCETARANAIVTQIARRLCAEFYCVVDDKYQTYCAFTSSVTQAVLAHYSIESTLLPCQLIHMTDESTHFIGFSGMPLPNQWDGHVVVSVRHLLLDFAVGSLARYHKLNVPRRVIAPRFGVRSNIIARVGLGGGRRLLWVNPPPGADQNPPPIPEDVVRNWSARLVEKLSEPASGSAVGEASPRGRILA